MTNYSNRVRCLSSLFGLMLLAPLYGFTESTPDESLIEESIPTLQARMARGDVSSEALVNFYLGMIERHDQSGAHLNAIASINGSALEQARELDTERRSGAIRGPLHGIPVLLKDNFETRGMPTTAGSKTLAGWLPPHDSYVTQRLRDAGAIILGKTNMHEFAYGITTIGSLFGETRNPYALDRNPGGSSGGTGAAIAANFAVVGMGTDTCGSVRIPSAQNNLVGLRGTSGLVSRRGIIPLSMTQDIAGPIARTVTDVAITMDALVGFDPEDAQTAESVGNVPSSYTAYLKAGGLKGASIGLLVDLLGEGEKELEVSQIIRRAAQEMVSQGARVVEVNIPRLQALLSDSLGGYYINVAEFKFDLQSFLDRHPSAPIRSLADVLASNDYHPGVKDVLELSQGIESLDTRDYRRALLQRVDLRRAILHVMALEGLDALLYPTIRQTAALLGEAQDGSNCHLSANSGLPAISVPAGFTPQGLPVGAELLGRAFQEGRLIELAYSYEQATGYRTPPMILMSGVP